MKLTVAPQNLTIDPGQLSSASAESLKIGVLALQGAFLEHANMLKTLGATPVEVRLPKDLEDLDGIPEMIAYFIAALAGGILFITILRGDYSTQRIKRTALDVCLLIVI